MNFFLTYTAKYLIEKHNSNFQDVVVVMPNRRSCLFLEHEFTLLLNKTSWLPQIVSLNDWINSKASLTKIDELLAIVKLYNAFKNIYSERNISFDEFYFTGQILLNDFNDIDSELVDAEKLFVNLQDLKEISDKFAFDEDFFKILSSYIHLFEKNTPLNNEAEIQDYLKIWNGLFKLYTTFRNDLTAEDKAYDGLLIRNFIENDFKKREEIKTETYYMVGFNALSGAEEKLFEMLHNQSKVLFLWEYDDEYIQNEQYSAGFYLRRLISKFPLPADFKIATSNLKNADIKIISLPNEISMAKYAASQLTEVSQKVALVLADESLLPVVLNSLPESIGKMNVTMGFPIKQTATYTLIKLLFKLRQQIRKGNNKIWVPRNIWMELLYHPFLFNDANVQQQINFFIKESSSSLAYIDLNSDSFKIDSNNTILSKLYDFCIELANTTYLELLLSFLSFLESIFLEEGESSVEKQLEIQAIRKIYNALTGFNELLKINQIKIEDAKLFHRLLNQILLNQKIDLFGEPLEGLQIMGLMESRLLDFEKVFVLSLNDKVIPGDKYSPTFILYSMRKYFGLSTPEKREAIDAFHFYRLIQRSRQSELFYSQFIGSDEADKSPYLRQLLFNSTWNIAEKIFNDKIGQSPENNSIVIDKKIIGIKWIDFIKNMQEKGLSQNAISTYIQCPLKFYFERVERLTDSDLFPDDSMDKDFGLIFHEAIERLFKDINKVTKDELINIKSNINQIADEVIAEKFEYSWVQILLLKEQLISLLNKFFDVEMQENSHFPCDNLSIETKYETFVNNIKLYGRVDMIIKNEKGIYVIDFKTGSEKEVSFDSLDELFTMNSQMAYAFQLAFYCFLYYKSQNQTKNVFAENIYIKKYSEAYKNVLSKKIKEEGKKRTQKEMLDFTLVSNVFEQKIAEKLEEILDENHTFVQTSDIKNCDYCNFKLLCRKN